MGFKKLKKFLSKSRAQLDALREQRNEKASHSTDPMFSELRERIDLLKGTNDGDAKKWSLLLEKELREFDILLQRSRALSEACQEKQNMLWSAMWDLETSVDELEHMVKREGRFLISSKTKSNINKELDLNTSRVVLSANAVTETALETTSCAKEVVIRRDRIREMASQTVREMALHTVIDREQDKVDKLSEDAIQNDNEIQASWSTSDGSNLVSQVEAERLNKNWNYKRMCVYMPILVIVLSGLLAAHWFQKHIIVL